MISESEISVGESSKPEPSDNENSSAASAEKNIEDDNNENTTASKSTSVNPDNSKALQYIMGHANITMTLNYYVHATYDFAKAEMERLAA